MKRSLSLRIITVSLFLFLFPIVIISENMEFRRITVHNEVEFIQALGNDRVITVAEGSLINLSKTLEYMDKRENVGLQDSEKEIDYSKLKTEGIKCFNTVFDGSELCVQSMKNLIIVGEGNTRPKIVVEPRYAYIFKFVNCVDVTLRHLEIGHTQQGECMGGVICLEDCDKIKIDDCDLYGCGTEGITSIRTYNLRCARTIIRDCSYSIMTLEKSEQVDFIDCQFLNNKEFSLVNVDKNSININFSNSEFRGNQGTLFLLESYITMENCKIYHPEESIGNTDFIRETNCIWKESSAESVSETKNDGMIPESPIKYYYWVGKMNGEDIHLVCAEQNGVYIGEVMTKKDQEVRFNRVLGVQEDMEIQFHLFDQEDVCKSCQTFYGTINEKTMVCFDPETQSDFKLRAYKGEIRYALDRKSGAYCSPFIKENVSHFKPNLLEIAGLYTTVEVNDKGNIIGTNNIDITRSGKNLEKMNFRIDCNRGGRQALTDGQAILEGNTFKYHLKYGECDYKFEVIFYNGFLIIRGLDPEQGTSGCFGSDIKINGVYVQTPSVG